MDQFLIKLLKYKSLSIIGMEKNTGKTTTLNFLLRVLKEKTIGLTSIGRDGEDKDIVTLTEKPVIYIRKGTIIATAKSSLLRSDATFEILGISDINTPIGEVVYARAISDGYVEIAGPSTKKGIKEVIGEIQGFGAEITIIDGALSRKTFAEPSVTEACILCTGAAFSENIIKLSEETAHFVKLLSINETDEKIKKLFKDNMDKIKLAFVKEAGIKKSEAKTSIGAAKEVIDNLKESVSYVFINGIITDSFVNELMTSGYSIKGVHFIVEDGTKLFINRDSYLRFLSKGVIIEALNKINIIGISVNPTSPSGTVLDYSKLSTELCARIKLPVFNVKLMNEK